MAVLRRSAGDAEHLVDRMVRNVEHGTFERSLSGLDAPTRAVSAAGCTAASALVTGVEIYLEHYKPSFGDKWMWSPIVLTPPLVVAGIGGAFSVRGGETVVTVAGAVHTANARRRAHL